MKKGQLWEWVELRCNFSYRICYSQYAISQNTGPGAAHKIVDWEDALYNSSLCPYSPLSPKTSLGTGGIAGFWVGNMKCIV